MKVQELRIGNLVNFNGETIEIVSIYTDLKTAFVNFDWEFNDYINISECECIPITNEWLLELGFEKQGMAYIKGDFDVTKWIDGKFMYGGKINLYVASVQQLQNLFFALTGEELAL